MVTKERRIVSAQVEEQLARELEERAHLAERSLSGEIRLALKSYLRRIDPDPGEDGAAA